jgi:hypothetical protein
MRAAVYGINPLAAIVQNASSFLWSKTERKMYRRFNNNFLVLDIIFCRKSLELTKIIIKKLIKLNEYGLSDLELHIDKETIRSEWSLWFRIIGTTILLHYLVLIAI